MDGPITTTRCKVRIGAMKSQGTTPRRHLRRGRVPVCTLEPPTGTPCSVACANASSFGSPRCHPISYKGAATRTQQGSVEGTRLPLWNGRNVTGFQLLAKECLKPGQVFFRGHIACPHLFDLLIDVDIALGRPEGPGGIAI